MSNISNLPDLPNNNEKINSEFNRLHQEIRVLNCTTRSKWMISILTLPGYENRTTLLLRNGSLYFIYTRTTFACQEEPCKKNHGNCGYLFTCCISGFGRSPVLVIAVLLSKQLTTSHLTAQFDATENYKIKIYHLPEFLLIS